MALIANFKALYLMLYALHLKMQLAIKRNEIFKAIEPEDTCILDAPVFLTDRVRSK